ncbi:MAG: fatty acid desaturase [Bryobacterales bacterium]|nr:fatty acid desaturase [Bryobacterales bacterium]
MAVCSAQNVPRAAEPRARLWKRKRVYLLSRCVICGVVAGSLGGLLLVPSNGWSYLADVLLRSYLAFVGTVMAHEGSHGLLGRTPRSNSWWGRLALVPCMVPFTNFRKTHLLHHRFTNEDSRDPDHFIKPGGHREWELPLRAVAMPHHWLFWLSDRNRVDKSHVLELLLNYVAIALVYSLILTQVGVGRLVSGMLPVLVLVSLVLWYPFAFKTHEGFSIGTAESRSHNYYGRLIYWFSFGLSMHRTHHMRPYLAWIELLQFVERDPSPRRVPIPRRDIRADRSQAASDAQPASQHA